jgi:hypothetical protein
LAEIGMTMYEQRDERKVFVVFLNFRRNKCPVLGNAVYTIEILVLVSVLLLTALK